jgi:hypothetical protein
MARCKSTSPQETSESSKSNENFRTTITQNLVFVKDFQKTDAQVTGFEGLSHF